MPTCLHRCLPASRPFRNFRISLQSLDDFSGTSPAELDEFLTVFQKKIEMIEMTSPDATEALMRGYDVPAVDLFKLAEASSASGSDVGDDSHFAGGITAEALDSDMLSPDDFADSMITRGEEGGLLRRVTRSQTASARPAAKQRAGADAQSVMFTPRGAQDQRRLVGDDPAEIKNLDLTVAIDTHVKQELDKCKRYVNPPLMYTVAHV